MQIFLGRTLLIITFEVPDEFQIIKIKTLLQFMLNVKTDNPIFSHVICFLPYQTAQTEKVGNKKVTSFLYFIKLKKSDFWLKAISVSNKSQGRWCLATW